jgi:hypothetical protein
LQAVRRKLRLRTPAPDIFLLRLCYSPVFLNGSLSISDCLQKVALREPVFSLLFTGRPALDRTIMPALIADMTDLPRHHM